MNKARLRLVILTAAVLIGALAGAGAAQISDATPVSFQIKEYHDYGNISGTPTTDINLVVDPDTVEATDLIYTVKTVVDSLSVVFSVMGRQGSIEYKNVASDTVTRTDLETYLPRPRPGVRDSLFGVVFTHTRPLVVGEQFRFAIIPVNPPIFGQIVTSVDTVDTADTLFYPAIGMAKEFMSLLITLNNSPAGKDSNCVGVGIQTWSGGSWAGGAFTRIKILADSTRAVQGGTARVDFTGIPAGIIRPVVYGRLNSKTVRPSRIKIIGRD